MNTDNTDKTKTSVWLRRALRGGSVLLVVVVAFIVGHYTSSGPSQPDHRHGASQGGGKKPVYTCSMHPQIQLSDPKAKCPLCGMDLIPADSGGAAQSSNPRELRLTERARALAEIQVTEVVRQKASAEVRVVGKVVYDERRMGYITSWVAGRIDRLFVKHTGAKVRRWQPMVYLYSPELVTTQMELIQAVKLARGTPVPGVTGITTAAQATLQAARHKLALLGLSAKQIARIEKRGKPTDHLTIHAPVGGVVVQKNAQEQMYVKPGTRLYTIADLRKVWVKLDVYESELARVKVGQTIAFTVETYPGETFKGTVEFIDPFVDNRTRTVKIRLTVDNANGRLKPDMFVRAVLESPIDASGKALAAGAAKSAQQPLVIPVSAPLITGKRAVVYVEVSRGVYQGREVVLGPRVGAFYVVREGVTEGDKVVTHGNFKIDSALQILARPSMMNPAPGSKARPGSVAATSQVTRRPAPVAFRKQLAAVVTAYYDVHHGLSRDRLEAAKAGAQRVLKALKAVPRRLIKGQARTEWRLDERGLRSATQALADSADIKTARRHFGPLSTHLILAVRRFGLAGPTQAIRFRCTMAYDNQGADWLQPKPGVENPYFGSQMFRCGDQHETLTRPEPLKTPARFRKQLYAVIDAYFAVHHGLSRDNLSQAKGGVRKLQAALKGVQVRLAKSPARSVWSKAAAELKGSADRVDKSADIKAARAAFHDLSKQLIGVVERFGVRGDKPVILFHCPMAFGNQGADWLQGKTGTENPYYGSQMFTCGDQKRVLSKRTL